MWLFSHFPTVSDCTGEHFVFKRSVNVPGTLIIVGPVYNNSRRYTPLSSNVVFIVYIVMLPTQVTHHITEP
jgi:hypothetical protein